MPTTSWPWSRLRAAAASGLYALVALHGEQQFTAIFTLAFSLFTLWYLFGNARTDEFFEHGLRSA